MRTLILAGFLAATAFVRSDPAPGDPPAEPTGVASLRLQARAVLPMLGTRAARDFVSAADALPGVPTRTLYVDTKSRRWFTPDQRDALPEAERDALTRRDLDEDYYYTTRYGSPIAYARAIDLGASLPGPNPLAGGLGGLSVVDYGCGGVGPLRLLAHNGARAIGLDTDPSLRLLYAQPGDTGVVAPREGAPAGTPSGFITLLTGRFPVDPACTPADLRSLAPDGVDMFLSKNTLKNGYIHPAEPVDKRMLVDLGTTEDQFLRSIRDALKPGGLVVIYNICPAPAKPGAKYIPWADGRCPFTREQWTGAGFEVLKLDEHDDDAVRSMARALGWDKDGMDVENDLFAWWSAARRVD